MADFLSHLKQAKHNRTFSEFILKSQPTYRDWAITTAFYTALHYAEACFPVNTAGSKQDRNEASLHQQRAEEIKRHSVYAFRQYDKLQKACWEVRYLTGAASSSSWREYYTQDVVTDLVFNKLPAFVAELSKISELDLS